MQQLPPDDSSSELARHYEYYQWIKRDLAKRGYTKEDADDLYQDLFLRALEHNSRRGTILLQTDDNLNKRIYRIVRNLEIDDYRRSKKIGFIYLPEDEEYTQLPGLMVEGHEDWICDRDRLREVLAQMPMRHQQCVWLIERGFKQKVIAEILGISESTVSESLRDVKIQLRKYYPMTADFKRVEVLYGLYAVRGYETEIENIWLRDVRESIESREKFAVYLSAVSDLFQQYKTSSDLLNALGLDSEDDGFFGRHLHNEWLKEASKLLEQDVVVPLAESDNLDGTVDVLVARKVKSNHSMKKLGRVFSSSIQPSLILDLSPGTWE